MTIEYDVTERDYVNFNLYHAKHSKHAKIAALILRYTTAALALLGFFILYTDKPLAIVVGVVFAIAWIALFPKYYEGSVKRTSKKMIGEGKNNDFIGRQKLTLGENCIEEVSETSASSVKYAAVEKVCRDCGAIYIYIGAIKAYIVPVTAFMDAQQESEFLNMLKQKTGIDAMIEGEWK